MGAKLLTAAPLPLELALAPQTSHFSGHRLLIPRVGCSRDPGISFQLQGGEGKRGALPKKHNQTLRLGWDTELLEGCECLPSPSLNKQLINPLILFLDPFFPSEEHSQSSIPHLLP